MELLKPLLYIEFIVTQDAPALRNRVVRFYQDDRYLEHASYLAHTFYLENDEPASTEVEKHTRFLREHFTPAYDGIFDEDVTEGIEFVVTAPGIFGGRKFFMRTCAAPRSTYRVWAKSSETDWRWRQFYMSRDHVAPFHAPFVTGDAVPPPLATVARGGAESLVVMRHYHRATGLCSYFYSDKLAALIHRGVMHMAAHGNEAAAAAVAAAASQDQLITETIPWYDALRAYEPFTVQWGSIGRLYGLKDDKAVFNGEIVAVNRLWSTKGETWAECMFLNTDIVGPVDVLEGHVASAEYIQTPAKLCVHLEMPISVHTFVGMIAKTAFFYVDGDGKVASRVRLLETPEGSVVCDRRSLRNALIDIGSKGSEWWQDKLMACLHTMSHGEGAYGSDPNRVTLGVRALRGLAEHCFNESRGDSGKVGDSKVASPETDEWNDTFNEVAPNLPRSRAKRGKKLKKAGRKARRHGKKKHGGGRK